MAFNLFKRREAESDTREQVLGDQGTASDVLLTSLINGERLTKDQALTIPAVAANVDLISNCIATMPVKLYKINKKTGSVEEVKDDPRTRLLNGDTGDTLDGYQLKKALVTDYLLDTGGYCYIGKYRNEVSGLYYVEPEYVVINYNYEPIYKSYYLYVGENAYKPYEFIKLLRNTTTGAYGRGIVAELGDALQNAYQTQKYQLGLVKTGGNKRGFLKSERRLGIDEINALKAAWRNLYANNTENVVVLNNGLDFKEAANTSVELQLNESIDNLIKQIDKIFHISSDFYETFKLAIYPIIKAFETALNRDLLLEKEKGKLFFEFDVKEIVKANIKERYEVYRIAKECGFMTKNEMRQAENMNEIEGLDVVDLGLGAALYDVNTHTYYTPNTDSQADLKTLEEESIIDHDNGSERAETTPDEGEAVELRYNHNHGKDGRFTFGSGSSKSGGSSGGKSGGSSKGSSSKQSSGSSGKSGGSGSSSKKTITSFNKDGETNPDGSIDMNYLHISNKNTPVANNNQYGQDLEPAGEYMSFIPEGTGHIKLDNYTYGTIHFDKPLQIEYKSTGANGWKNDLSKMFGGKTGKALSDAIKAAGYDAVVTYEIYKGDKNWVEIVNLCGEKGG